MARNAGQLSLDEVHQLLGQRATELHSLMLRCQELEAENAKLQERLDAHKGKDHKEDKLAVYKQ